MKQVLFQSLGGAELLSGVKDLLENIHAGAPGCNWLFTHKKIKTCKTLAEPCVGDREGLQKLWVHCQNFTAQTLVLADVISGGIFAKTVLWHTSVVSDNLL